MMLSRKLSSVAALGGLALLTACGGGKGIFGRDAPDEFAVSRSAPLVVPPDFALTPPKPGAPRPQAVDSQGQAVEALFGPGVRVAPPSASESTVLDKAGNAAKPEASIRSVAGDPNTVVSDKGPMAKSIVDAPAGDTDPSVATVHTGPTGN